MKVIQKTRVILDKVAPQNTFLKFALCSLYIYGTMLGVCILLFYLILLICFEESEAKCYRECQNENSNPGLKSDYKSSNFPLLI